MISEKWYYKSTNIKNIAGEQPVFSFHFDKWIVIERNLKQGLCIDFRSTS